MTTGGSGSDDESSGTSAGSGIRGIEGDTFFMQSTSSGATAKASVNKYGWIYTRPRLAGEGEIPKYHDCGTSSANGCVPISSSSPSPSSTSIPEEREATCTQQQLDSGYQTPAGGNQCLPPCNWFYRNTVSRPKGVEITFDDNCNDLQNYNILEIKGTLSKKCCRKSPKRSCPVGYKFVSSANECYPTCATATKLAGYTGRQQVLEPRCAKWTCLAMSKLQTRSCQDLKKYGKNDWQDFSFYDPFRFKDSNNKDDISEKKIRKEEHHCCIRGTPNHNKQLPYDQSNGWHPQDRKDLLPGPSPTP